ncbi:MAG: cytochrome c3 family protein [Thermodesulfovibrionales bacterium]|jgi:predicted CXXCH cytochrome family protein
MKGKMGGYVFFFAGLAAVGAISLASLTVDASIMTTKHNLSVSGPGPVKATTETQVCVFCHTPHGATGAPLWNHTLSTAPYYTVPSKDLAAWSTLLSTPQNPPDGDSRLCLSCHDGTVAVGSVVNLGGSPTTITMQGTEGGMIPSGSGTGPYTSNIEPGRPSMGSIVGTDLSGHHPVSVEVTQALLDDKGLQCANGDVSMRVCTPIAPIKLKPTDNRYVAGPHTGLGVQCASCHDPHENGLGKFLRAGVPGNATDLCVKCHRLCTEDCP